MGIHQAQPSEEQLAHIHAALRRLGFFVYFWGRPDAPWEGGLLFALQSAPGRTLSTTLFERVVGAFEDVLGKDAEFFVEDIGMLDDETLTMLREL